MEYNYKKFQDESLKKISQEKIILDVGGGERFTKWLKEYKDILEVRDYKTFDYDSKTNPDVVGDIHSIPLPDESIDAIICSSVLEHVENPNLAVKEMHRILKKGGKIFVYVPSIYPYHARKGHYPDYWRIFDDTLERLFSKFTHVKLQKVGGYFRAMFFFVPFQDKLKFILQPLSYFLDKVFGTEKKTTTSGYMLYAEK